MTPQQWQLRILHAVHRDREKPAPSTQFEMPVFVEQACKLKKMPLWASKLKKCSSGPSRFLSFNNFNTYIRYKEIRSGKRGH